MPKTLEEYVAKLPIEEQVEIKKLSDELIAKEYARRESRKTKCCTRSSLKRPSTKRKAVIHPLSST